MLTCSSHTLTITFMRAWAVAHGFTGSFVHTCDVSERVEPQVCHTEIGWGGGGGGLRSRLCYSSHNKMFLCSWSLHTPSFSCETLEDHWRLDSGNLFPSGQKSIRLLHVSEILKKGLSSQLWGAQQMTQIITMLKMNREWKEVLSLSHRGRKMPTYVYLACAHVSSQSCPTLWSYGSYGAHKAPLSMKFSRQILDWVAISFSRVFSRPRDQTWVSCIADRFSTMWAMYT